MRWFDPGSPEYSEGLGKWVGLPVLGLALNFVAIFAPPDVDCAGPDPGMTPGRAIFIGLSLIAATASLLGAIYRIAALVANRRFHLLRDGGLLTASVVLIVLVFGNPWIQRDGGSFEPQVFAGLAASIGSFLYLLVALAQGLRADEVGAFVPVCLVATVVFVYFPFTAFIWGASHGGLC